MFKSTRECLRERVPERSRIPKSAREYVRAFVGAKERSVPERSSESKSTLECSIVVESVQKMIFLPFAEDGSLKGHPGCRALPSLG